MTGVARAAAWSTLALIAATCSAMAFAAGPDPKASVAAAGKRVAPAA